MQMGTDGHERITIETERILIVVQRQVARGWCQNCGREVDLHAGNGEAGFVSGSERFEVRRQTKPRFVRARNRLSTCLKSLLRFLPSARVQGDCSHLPGGCGNETKSEPGRTL